MVLMGISQGGYLGKKLVTFGTPMLYPPVRKPGRPRTPVTLRGASLDSSPDRQLLLNGLPVDGTTWSAASVQFTVPLAILPPARTGRAAEGRLADAVRRRPTQ